MRVEEKKDPSVYVMPKKCLWILVINETSVDSKTTVGIHDSFTFPKESAFSEISGK